jgi:hypothetical protein
VFKERSYRRSSMISEAKPELVSTKHGGAILRRRRKGFVS